MFTNFKWNVCFSEWPHRTSLSLHVARIFDNTDDHVLKRIAAVYINVITSPSCERMSIVNSPRVKALLRERHLDRFTP